MFRVYTAVLIAFSLFIGGAQLYAMVVTFGWLWGVVAPYGVSLLAIIAAPFLLNIKE